MNNKNFLIIPIKGMHCRSCEILIEDELREVKNVSGVEVNYKIGEAKVFYEQIIPDKSALEKKITKNGYSLGVENKKPLINKNSKDYKNLGLAFLIIFLLYLILKLLGIIDFNINPNEKNLSWGFILLIGLVAGLSTCMALVGGLVLSLTAKFAVDNPTATISQKFKPHLFFSIGRIVAYTLLGGLLGIIGSALKISNTANGIMVILVAFLMIFIGLQLTAIFPRFSNLKIVLPKFIARFFNHKSDNYSNQGALVLGALTFFLPCGFTQAMQLYAISTGSFFSGAVALGLFALGTAPGLLSIGGLSSLVKGRFKEVFFKSAGLAVIIFGLFNLVSGYNLISLTFDSVEKDKKINKVVNRNIVIENGFQIIKMTENNRGYSPNNFTLQKGIPVRWIINAEAPYSCASALIVPKYKIRSFLKAGENVIEFTPTEVGVVTFSCSMGMYRGRFNIVE